MNDAQIERVRGRGRLPAPRTREALHVALLEDPSASAAIGNRLPPSARGGCERGRCEGACAPADMTSGLSEG
jgi:hypothetical protein